jgi:hypothetical protein
MLVGYVPQIEGSDDFDEQQGDRRHRADGL